MAITVPGSPVVTEANSAFVNGVRPSLTANTDVLLIAYVTASSTFSTHATGWQWYWAGNQTGVFVNMYYRAVRAAAVATEPIDYLWSQTTSGPITSIIQAFYGVGNLDSPIGSLPVASANSAASTSGLLATLTIPSAGDWLIVGAGANTLGNSGNTISSAGGFQTVAAQATGVGRTSAMLYETIPSIGASGTRTVNYATSCANTQYEHVLRATPKPIFMRVESIMVGTTSFVVFSQTSALMQKNDIAIILLESAGGQAINVVGGANGIQQIPNTPAFTGTGTAGTRLTAFWTRAYGGHKFNTTNTNANMGTGATFTVTGGDHLGIASIIVRGAKTTGSPFAVSASGTKPTASTAVTLPALTTPVADCYIVEMVTHDLDTSVAAFAPNAAGNLSLFTELYDVSSTSGTGGGLAYYGGGKETAGSTGTPTLTVTSSVNAFAALAVEPHNNVDEPKPRIRDAAGSAYSGTSASTRAPTVPSVIVTGDLLVLTIAANVGAPGLTMDVPGWTQIDERSTSNNCSIGVFWKIADANNTATVNFDRACNCAAMYHVIEGAHATAPIDTLAVGGHGTSSPLTFPSVTTSYDNCRILRLAAMNASNSYLTPDAGMTERGSIGCSQALPLGGFVSVLTDDAIKATAGATSTRSMSTSAVTEWYTVSLSLRPASLINEYSDFPTTTIVGTSTSTDAQALTQPIQLDITAITTETDQVPTAYTETLTTTVVATTSIVDTYTATGIPGCTIHYDMSLENYSNAQPMTTLIDRSGNGSNAYYVAGTAAGGPPLMSDDIAGGLPYHDDGTYGLRIPKTLFFAKGMGCLRFTASITSGSYDMSVFVVSRIWDTSNGGRTLTNSSGTGYNVLVGTWGAAPGNIDPAAYDNGWIGTGAPSNPGTTIPWRVYGLNCRNSPRISEFRIWGGIYGSHTTSTGHGWEWQINGYTTPDNGVADETCHGEVSEIIFYNRYLEEAEVQTVSAYLANKWYWHSTFSVASSDNTYCVTQSTTYVTDDHQSHAPVNYTDSVTTTIVAPSSIAASVGTTVSCQTDITYGDLSADKLGAVEALLTVITTLTELTSAISRADSISDVISSSTGATDFQARYEDVRTDAVHTTSATSLLTMYDLGYSIVAAITSQDDIVGGNLADNVTTTIVGTTEITEVVSYRVSISDTIIALTGETEQLSMYTDLITTIAAQTTAPEVLGRYENVLDSINATTADVISTVVLVSVVLTVINAETSQTELLNGTPPPVEGYLLYQAGPFKVMGKI